MNTIRLIQAGIKTCFMVLMFTITTTEAQIPNFSFETWNTMSGYSNPDQWGTMNNATASDGIYTATMGTPGNPGASFLKLTSQTVGANVINGIAVSGILDTITMQPVSGFAFNQRPEFFYTKCQFMYGFATSPSSVSVTLSRWDTGLNQRVTVATINENLPGMVMIWSDCNFGFTYLDGSYPDTCIIVFKASGANPNPLDYLWVDNLVFAGTVAGVDDINNTESSIDIFPNPVVDIININISSMKNETSLLRLHDVLGKTIYMRQMKLHKGNNNFFIPIKSLRVSEGIYFLSVNQNQRAVTKKVVIQ